ncbi:unnamed protein product [Amoebophrya sp. A120]|nr:unnamed protein product [Amoebophrya sp. A120]|eukprot:GSA120T00009124001.1
MISEFAQEDSTTTTTGTQGDEINTQEQESGAGSGVISGEITEEPPEAQQSGTSSTSTVSTSHNRGPLFPVPEDIVTMNKAPKFSATGTTTESATESVDPEVSFGIKPYAGASVGEKAQEELDKIFDYWNHIITVLEKVKATGLKPVEANEPAEYKEFIDVTNLCRDKFHVNAFHNTVTKSGMRKAVQNDLLELANGKEVGIGSEAENQNKAPSFRGDIASYFHRFFKPYGDAIEAELGDMKEKLNPSEEEVQECVHNPYLSDSELQVSKKCRKFAKTISHAREYLQLYEKFEKKLEENCTTCKNGSKSLNQNCETKNYIRRKEFELCDQTPFYEGGNKAPVPPKEEVNLLAKTKAKVFALYPEMEVYKAKPIDQTNQKLDLDALYLQIEQNVNNMQASESLLSKQVQDVTKAWLEKYANGKDYLEEGFKGKVSLAYLDEMQRQREVASKGKLAYLKDAAKSGGGGGADAKNLNNSAGSIQEQRRQAVGGGKFLEHCHMWKKSMVFLRKLMTEKLTNVYNDKSTWDSQKHCYTTRQSSELLSDEQLPLDALCKQNAEFIVNARNYLRIVDTMKEKFAKAAKVQLIDLAKPENAELNYDDVEIDLVPQVFKKTGMTDGFLGDFELAMSKKNPILEEQLAEKDEILAQKQNIDETTEKRAQMNREGNDYYKAKEKSWWEKDSTKMLMGAWASPI